MDRFRLIYLKSSETEKPSTRGVTSRPRSEMSANRESTFHEFNGKGTRSAQITLQQAQSDLKHPDGKVRVMAIQYLERLRRETAIPLIKEMLSDPEPSVRIQALSSLLRFQSPDLVPSLKKLVRDPDPKMRIAALRGMFQNGEKIELNLLIQLLSDESPWVRRKLATLLGWSRMEGVLPILMEMSKDPEVMVRKAALLSLQSLYPGESETRWIEAMNDPDRDLRKWVRNVLEKRVSSSFKSSRLGKPTGKENR